MTQSLKQYPVIEFDFGDTGAFVPATKETAILRSFVLTTGPDPNSAEIEFPNEVPSGFMKVGGNYPISIKINDTIHRFVTTVSGSRSNPTRTKTLSCIQPGRGVIFKSRRVTRLYNQEPKTKFNPDDSELENRDEYGFWWRPSKGDEPEFVSLEGIYVSEFEHYTTLGINAYQAIYDIDNQFADGADVLILPKASALLNEYILPPTDFSETSEIDAIQSILNMAGSFWMYEIDIDETPRLLIGAKGSDTDVVDMIYGATGDNIRTLYHEDEDEINTIFHYIDPHTEEQYKFLVTKNNVQLQSKSINAVHAIGANRRYFIKHAILFPAWDYWNDYLFVARNSRSMKIVDLSSDAALSHVAEANAQIWSHIKSYGTGLVCTSLPIMLDIIETIKTWDKDIREWYADEFKVTSASGYIINVASVDALLNPDDPYHQYRFRRFVALPKEYEWSQDIESAYMSQSVHLRRDGYGRVYGSNPERKLTPSYKDLQYIRNIQGTIVDGRLTRIDSSMLLGAPDSHSVSGSESLQYSIPVIAEFFKGIPALMDPASVSKDAPKTNSQWLFDWWYANPRIDGENGFISVELKDASGYIPETSTPITETVNANVFSISMADTIKDGQYVDAHNVVNSTVAMGMLCSGRASLVYSEREDHAINPKWDEINDGFRQNTVQMAATITLADAEEHGMIPDYMIPLLNENDGSDPATRVYGEGTVERDSIWMTDVRNPYSNFATVEYNDPNMYVGFLKDQFGGYTQASYIVRHVIRFVLRDDRDMLTIKAIGSLLRQTGDMLGGDLEVIAPYGIGQGLGLGRITNLKIGDDLINTNINIKEMSLNFGDFTWSVRFELSASFYPQIYSHLRATLIDYRKNIRNLQGTKRVGKLEVPIRHTEQRPTDVNSAIAQISNNPLTNRFIGSLNYDQSTGDLVRQATPPSRLPHIGFASAANVDAQSAFRIYADTERNVIVFTDGVPATQSVNTGFIGVSNALDIEET